MRLVINSVLKAIDEHRIKWRSKVLVDLNYVQDLSFLAENVSKMECFFIVLKVQGARIDLKITDKTAKEFRLEIREGEQGGLGYQKIDQVDSFAHLCSSISQDSGCSDDVKCRIAKP